MSSTVNSANATPNPTHHRNGACRISTRLLTSSLNEVSVTSGATTGASAGSSLGRLIAMG
jgi:hypothetical protein